MTPTNCKCLQKCSLASLGQSLEIKGHVCPSICLFVCLFVYLFFFCFLFSELVSHHVSSVTGTENLSQNRIGAVHPMGNFFNHGSGFIYISSSLNHSVEVQVAKCLHYLFWLLREHSYSATVLQYDNFSLFLFKVFLIGAPRLIYAHVEFVWSDRVLSSTVVSTQLQFTKYISWCFFHYIWLMKVENRKIRNW